MRMKRILFTQVNIFRICSIRVSRRICGFFQCLRALVRKRRSVMCVNKLILQGLTCFRDIRPIDVLVRPGAICL